MEVVVDTSNKKILEQRFTIIYFYAMIIA